VASAIAPQTRPGPVHVTVSDLARSVDYYREAVGLEVVEQGAGRASLGAGGGELLVLVEEEGAHSSRGYSGLYHFALLVPERVQLAAWLAHAARDGVPLVGLSDHEVSEALYLADPDGHGIEIYRDRPRETWEGHIGERLTTMPLDVEDLLGELDDPASAPFDGLPAGTVMGHVHLKVADIPATIAFYRDVLGFDLTAQLGSQAAFLSAGGYHHHVGANTWESAGAPPPPPGTAALRHTAILFPDAAARDEVVARVEDADGHIEEHDGAPLVRDPSGNALVLTVA
jgi:catechol 2,3-dioxygenase